MNITDKGGETRNLELVGTCKDGTKVFREPGTGVVADNADGIRLYEDAGAYVESLPSWDRAEVAAILAKN